MTTCHLPTVRATAIRNYICIQNRIYTPLNYETRTRNKHDIMTESFQEYRLLTSLCFEVNEFKTVV